MIRPGLAFVSAFLLIVGLEMSTEAVSLVLGRLRLGFAAVVAGNDFHISPLRFAIGVLALAVGVTVWLLLIWSVRRQREVATVGSSCPQCGNPARRVKRKEWQRLLSVLLGERLARRRCDTCGWSGLSVR